MTPSRSRGRSRRWWQFPIKTLNQPNLEDTMPTQSTVHSSKPLLPTVEARIQALHTERAEIEASDQSDPIRAAVDLPAWHARADQRRRRLVEIEAGVRDLEEYRSVVDDHPDALRYYLANVAQIKARLERVARERMYTSGTGDNSQSGRADITTWMRELERLSRAIGDTEDARMIITRELAAWFLARDGWAFAVLAQMEIASLPSPELGLSGELPPWCGYGVFRLDQHR